MTKQLSQKEIDKLNKARARIGMEPYKYRKDYSDYLKDASKRESDPIYHGKKPIKIKYESLESLKEEELKE